jgi:hypothetical protein
MVCAGRLLTGGEQRTLEPSVHTGVLEMARCERVMILGREVSCDARRPLVTGRYKATEVRFGRMRIPRGS